MPLSLVVTAPIAPTLLSKWLYLVEDEYMASYILIRQIDFLFVIEVTGAQITLGSTTQIRIAIMMERRPSMTTCHPNLRIAWMQSSSCRISPKSKRTAMQSNEMISKPSLLAQSLFCVMMRRGAEHLLPPLVWFHMSKIECHDRGSRICADRFALRSIKRLRGGRFRSNSHKFCSLVKRGLQYRWRGWGVSIFERSFQS